MSQNLQNFANLQKFQLENLVDFEKCCKTHIFLQKSEPIQPKTSNVLPKFCQPTRSDVSAAATPSGSSGDAVRDRPTPSGPRPAIFSPHLGERKEDSRRSTRMKCNRSILSVTSFEVSDTSEMSNLAKCTRKLSKNYSLIRNLWKCPEILSKFHQSLFEKQRH